MPDVEGAAVEAYGTVGEPEDEPVVEESTDDVPEEDCE